MPNPMKITPGECEWGFRKDTSMWISIGDPLGKHSQFDWYGFPEDAAFVCEAFTVCNRLQMMPSEMEQRIKELTEALEAVKQEWPHEAPQDCYSTGPLTGNIIRDHVSCPGCEVARKIDAALKGGR